MYLTNEDNPTNKAKEHSYDGAGENYSGSFCYFLQALIYGFGQGLPI